MKKVEQVTEAMRLVRKGAVSEAFEVVKVDAEAGTCTLEHADPRQPLVVVSLARVAEDFVEDPDWYETVRELEEGRAQARAMGRSRVDVDEDGIPNWTPEHI